MQIRVEGEKSRGYERHQFEEAFARYLASEGVSNRYSDTNADNTGTSGTSATGTAEKPVPDGKHEKSNNDGLCPGVPDAKGGNGQERPIGLSQQAIEALADRVRHYAADHVDDADLTASTERSLRYWVAEAGVLPEHVATEAERVMTRVWRTY